mgnify:CR=1 FL=1
MSNVTIFLSRVVPLWILLMSDLAKTGKLKMLKSQPKTPYKQTHKFDNGYGASVIMNDISYGGKNGLYEIAVTRGGSIMILRSQTM